MKDTNQLPEPELGYIKTDKSNQPAFSARQMREAMEHALQARAQATQAEVQQPATAIACGIPGMTKTTCPYCEQGFAFEHEQPTTTEPVNLQHMAVAENGALRWMTGRKVQNCELYAMPDFGRAPTLYTTPPASQEQADAATSAGTQAAIGHLSRLVDEATSLISQLRTMVDDMHEQWSIGGVPERGEFPLLDRVDDWLSARPSQEQAQQTKCACGDRPVDQCDEEWGPNCDLGNNEKYVRVAHQPSVTVRYDLSPAMVEGAIRDRLIAMGWTPPLQQPKPQPMTDDEIEIAYQHTASKQSFMSFRHGIRSAEAHHGITAQAKPGGGT